MKSGMALGLRGSAKLNLRGRLIGRLQAAKIIGLPEREFAKFIQEIEMDPMFLKLYLPEKGAPRVIRRNPWTRAGLSGSFYAFDENLAAGSSAGVPVESLLAGKAELVGLIRRIGREAFEKYFLYGEDIRSLEEIAGLTGLSPEEARRIHEMILEVGVQSLFSEDARAQPALRFTQIARIEVDEASPERPLFLFNLPYMARGRYLINQQVLDELKDRGVFKTREEKKSLRRLIEKINLANLRQSTLFRILETVCAAQAKYLATGKTALKKPLSMRSLARELCLAPSTISRAAHGRGVKLPWGQEAPLSALMPARREVIRSILDEVLPLWPKEKKRSDRRLSKEVQARYGLAVNRRTLNAVRNAVEEQAP
ncbi:MAG: hypothetical protein HYT79_03475 [Elusimicrobia bacterium]|nr:hypothetical protein [Elusimicrobiota bacterium]